MCDIWEFRVKAKDNYTPWEKLPIVRTYGGNNTQQIEQICKELQPKHGGEVRYNRLGSKQGHYRHFVTGKLEDELHQFHTDYLKLRAQLPSWLHKNQADIDPETYASMAKLWMQLDDTIEAIAEELLK